MPDTKIDAQSIQYENFPENDSQYDLNQEELTGQDSECGSNQKELSGQDSDANVAEENLQSQAEKALVKDSIDSNQTEKNSFDSEKVLEKPGSISSESSGSIDSTGPTLSEVSKNGSSDQYEIISDTDSSVNFQLDEDIETESSDEEALKKCILEAEVSESVEALTVTSNNKNEAKTADSKLKVLKEDFEVKKAEIFTFPSKNSSNEPPEERKIETYRKKSGLKSSNPFLEVEVADTVELLLDEVESQVRDDHIHSPKKLKIQKPNTLVVVNGEEYPAHKELLIAESTYFRDTFAENKNRDAVVHIQSDFMIPRVFKALMTFLYTGVLIIPSRDILKLYNTSCHLGMEKLTEACLKVLDLSVHNLKNVFNVYQVSCQLNKPDSKRFTSKVLAANLESVVMENDFLELAHDQVIEILSEPIVGARSESVLFLAALRWLAHDPSAREQHACALLRCVDFSSLTLREALACFHPPILPGVVEVPEVRTMLLNATCWLCAKAVGKEHLFTHLRPRKRTLLLKEKPLILWSTEKPRLDAHLTRAATQIQALYRGYRARKALFHSPDPLVKKWYESYSMAKFFEGEIQSEAAAEIVQPRDSPPASTFSNYMLFLKCKSQNTCVFADDLE